jgi:hypothetical protein
MINRTRAHWSTPPHSPVHARPRHLTCRHRIHAATTADHTPYPPSLYSPLCGTAVARPPLSPSLLFSPLLWHKGRLVPLIATLPHRTTLATWRPSAPFLARCLRHLYTP